MHNANTTRSRHVTALVCCVLSLAVASCAKAPPATAAGSTRSALDQLRRDLTQATRAPGVQRAVWGVVVQSLDRNERLYELQPDTLLVPASVAKLAAVATAAEAVGWDYTYETALLAAGTIRDGVLVGDLLAVPVTGAYGHSMGSNYNKVPRPPVVFVRDGDARLVVRRETYDDLLRTDLG